MSFPAEAIPTIIGRGAISIILYIPDPDNPNDVQYGRLEVQVKRSDGIQVRTFDLLARLTDDAAGQTHLANLVSLRPYIISRVNSEILGL